MDVIIARHPTTPHKIETYYVHTRYTHEVANAIKEKDNLSDLDIKIVRHPLSGEIQILDFVADAIHDEYNNEWLNELITKLFVGESGI